MKRVFASLFLFAIFCTSYAQIDESLSYDELRTNASNLYGEAKFDSAIVLMKYAVNKFPAEDQWSTMFLAQLYLRADRNAEALEVWTEGMDKGYNYHLTSPAYARFFEDDKDFNLLLNYEKTRLDTAHIKHEIVLPIDYNSTNSYPVLFIFHGNNRKIEKSKVSWKSQILKDEFITVFLQSYVYSNDINYVWKFHDTKTQDEFKTIFNKVLTAYPVDTTKIFLAGMSAGGELAIDFALINFVPVSGVVLNCPVVPVDISDEVITQFIEKNNRIGIITGENDFALDSQESLINRIQEGGGESKITVSKDLGHEFASDFSSLLDEYLKWVIK